jgi:hypothetical protein
VAAVSGCRTADTNFSRVLDEPAPLPEHQRASFGVVGVFPPGASQEFHFPYPATPGEVMAERSSATFAMVGGFLAAAAASSAHDDHSHNFDGPHTPSNLPRDHPQREDRSPASGRPHPPSTPSENPAPSAGASKTASASSAKDTHSHDSGKNAKHDGSASGPGFADGLGEEVGGVLLVLAAAGVVSLADGAIEALFTGVSKAEAQRLEAMLQQALKDEPLQPGIQTRLTQIAARSGLRKLVQVPDPIFATPSQTATNQLAAVPAVPWVDSMLVIQISDQGFLPAASLSRSLFFAAEARALVVRASDGQVMHTSVYHYQSRARTFTDWGANNAKNLRWELQQAQQILAEIILQQFFALSPGKA